MPITPPVPLLLADVQFGTSLGTASLTLLASAIAVLSVVALTRANGLLSFSKMAPHDFASTIAVGSLLATTATGGVPVAQGLAGLVGVFVTQRAVQLWRRHGGRAVTDNSPLLLMAGSEVLEENLKMAGMAHADLTAKLRENNVTDRDRVYAMVLETTGDVSVIHGEPEEGALDPSLLEHVRATPAEEDWPTTWRRGDDEPMDGGQ